MLRFLFTQPRNIWKQLGRWHQTQVILLIGLIFVYLITRIQPQLIKMDADGQAAAISLYVYTLIFWSTGPFILRTLIPRQRNLRVFYILPMEPVDRLKLIGYFYYKYQIVLFILFLPFASALFLTSWLYGLLHFIFI